MRVSVCVCVCAWVRCFFFYFFLIFAHVLAGVHSWITTMCVGTSPFGSSHYEFSAFPCVINARRLFMVNKGGDDSSQICSLQVVEPTSWCLGPPKVEVGFIKVGLWVWKDATALLFIFPLFCVLLDHTKKYTQTEPDNHCSLHRSPLNREKKNHSTVQGWAAAFGRRKSERKRERREEKGAQSFYKKKEKERSNK